MPRTAPRGLLIDLDGVLRRWDAREAAEIEERHGLAPGAIAATALHWPRLLPAITGQVAHDRWLAEAAQVLGSSADPDAAAAAVAAWARRRGAVDRGALALVREARAAGRPVALATNATDRLRADLAELGLDAEFDAVVSSAEVGAAKPSREFFAAAAATLGLPERELLLVDDDDRMVRGARVAGLAAYRWAGPGDTGYPRAALGLDRVPG
ncbi:MAG TPA: HAD-IA family hydrolase [Pilimelia sp.]|nr:HAD-IA family hydrolase [Pilimelia sp.]